MRFHFQPHCPCKHCDPPIVRKWLVVVAVLCLGLSIHACYAHTPTPSCAQDPSGEGCLGPLQDDRAPDAGR